MLRPHHLILIVLSFVAPLLHAADISVYGQLPALRSPSISPDGRHLAFIARAQEHDRFVVYDLEDGRQIYMGEVSAFKARGTSFITNKHALLWGSETTFSLGYRGQARREHTGAVVYNLETGKTRALLRDEQEILRAQSGLGRIVGVDQREAVVYMPAYANSFSPSYNLYRIRLSSGQGRLFAEGTSHTRDWFVDSKGKVIAREDLDTDKHLHTVHSLVAGDWRQIYLEKSDIPSMSIIGVSPDGAGLVVSSDNNERPGLYRMALDDGELSGPLYHLEDADVEQVLMSDNQVLEGVVYSGFKPAYEFVDDRFTRLFVRLGKSFPGSSVYFESWSEGGERIIIRVSGNEGSGTYYLVDAVEGEVLSNLGSQYAVDSIAEIKAFRYRARDGLSIPALVTFPPGSAAREQLPLIVLPHGGPEAYDQIGFSWLPQFLAARGYLVLQPNFRGSTGFGKAFRDAGRGSWGREMQDDVSDGVLALVKAGYADKARVCIMGGSYGGYSALAGGAFSPDLYRCVVAFNGISDLERMISERKNRLGDDHWVVNYWHELIGDSNRDREKLRAISPVNFAENFRAPVLLVHGKDDLVVPLVQSERMDQALKEAGKSVELVVLGGEDHWLSSSRTRLQLLQQVDDFLQRHNPPGEKSAR